MSDQDIPVSQRSIQQAHGKQKRQKVGEEIPSEQSDSCISPLLPSNDSF